MLSHDMTESAGRSEVSLSCLVSNDIMISNHKIEIIEEEIRRIIIIIREEVIKKEVIIKEEVIIKGKYKGNNRGRNIREIIEEEI